MLRTRRKLSLENFVIYLKFRTFDLRTFDLTVGNLALISVADPKKNGLYDLRNMIRVVHPGSGSGFFTHPGSRGQKATGSQIRFRNTGTDFLLPWPIRSTVRWKGWALRSCCPAPALRCTWNPRGRQSNRRVYNIVFYSKFFLTTLLNFNAKKTGN